MLMKLKLSQQPFEKELKYKIFMKIRWAWTEFLHPDGRTDRYDEGNSWFFEIFWTRLKNAW